MDYNAIQHGVDKAFVHLTQKFPEQMAELKAAGFINTNNMYKYESAILRKTVYYINERGHRMKSYTIHAIVFDMSDLGIGQKFSVTYHATLGSATPMQTDVEFGNKDINKTCVEEALQRMQNLFDALGKPHYE